LQLFDCRASCEDQHQRSLPRTHQLLDVKVSQDIIYTHQNALSGLAFTAAKFSAANPATTDSDVLAALQALAETYKTLGSGIYYEKPPDAPLPRELYATFAAFMNESKQQSAERTSASAFAGAVPVKDSKFSRCSSSSIGWACCARAVPARAAISNFYAANSPPLPNSSARIPHHRPMTSHCWESGRKRNW
jgi:hypothetical protein